MKIASYNLWRSESGLPLRKRQIVDEILALNSELICLQEVESKRYFDELASNCDYLYSYFANHEGEDEGLGIFSKTPIIEKGHIHNAIICTFYIEKQILLVGNVHLSWDSVLKESKKYVVSSSLLSL